MEYGRKRGTLRGQGSERRDERMERSKNGGECITGGTKRPV